MGKRVKVIEAYGEVLRMACDVATNRGIRDLFVDVVRGDYAGALRRLKDATEEPVTMTIETEGREI